MLMLSQFDAIFFDFDGVIVDSVELKISAFGELYADHGEEIRGMVEAYQRAHPGETRFEKIPMFHRSLLGIELSPAAIAAECDRLGEIILDEVVACPLMPDIAEALRVLRSRDIPCHIVSGTPQDELAEIVERKGIGHFFRSIHGSPRSKSAISEDIFAMCGYDRSRSLFIGDAMTDYRCAIACNMPFLGIGDLAGSPFPFGTHVVERLGETFLEIATARLGRRYITPRPATFGRRIRAA